MFTVLNIINNIKLKIKEFKFAIALHLLLFFVVLWTRFVFLGYSDYQGDEIKAMFSPQPGQSAWEFFLEQKKGPVQFIVTAIMHPFSNNYYNNFVLRFPFALAGALAVLFFYKFVNLHFGRKVAVYSALFFALNGYLIAFSRIVQYQSFTILFMCIALYLFSKAFYKPEWKYKGWLWGGFYWGLSVLSHYDGVFIAPFVFYLFIVWFKKYSHIPTREKVLTIIKAGLITITMLAVFYIPFIFSIGQEQISYWLGRIEGTNGKLESSFYLFKVYNPVFIYLVYVGLTLLSLFKIKKLWPIITWAIFPLAFMEGLVQVPGTHVYTYLIPITILMAYGLIVSESLITQLFGIFAYKVKPVFYFVVSVYFLLHFLMMHTIFIDHSPEYPWTHKKFLIWDLARPNPQYNLSLFGFPYYRHWEEIEDYMRSSGITRFSTNERAPITRFYLEDIRKDGSRAEAYVHIYDPQSFTFQITQNKPYYWVNIKKYEPNMLFKNGDTVVAKVYNMPGGELEDIEALGY